MKPYVAKLLEADVDSVVRETKRYAQVVSILQSVMMMR